MPERLASSTAVTLAIALYIFNSSRFPPPLYARYKLSDSRIIAECYTNVKYIKYIFKTMTNVKILYIDVPEVGLKLLPTSGTFIKVSL